MLKVGVVGATGVVGQSFIELLKSRNFPVKELRPFASAQSAGKTIELGGTDWEIQALHEGCFDNLDVVFFSSGENISIEWAPKAVAAGAFAVDNSSAFRMNPDYPLVVPEVNGDLLDPDKPTIIANPNCSTIQLVLALAPLQKAFGLKEVRIATYQAVSGAGKEAIDELKNQSLDELNGKTDHQPDKFPKQIAFNCIPEIGSYAENDFCTEELKLMNETRKILNQKDLFVSAFAVRVPAINGHSEAVWVTLKKDTDNITQVLQKQEGLFVHTDPKEYPIATEVSGQMDVSVGRIHKDAALPNTWLMWVVGDNLLKGAALNGIQVAEKLFKL